MLEPGSLKLPAFRHCTPFWRRAMSGSANTTMQKLPWPRLAGQAPNMLRANCRELTSRPAILNVGPDLSHFFASPQVLKTRAPPTRCDDPSAAPPSQNGPHRSSPPIFYFFFAARHPLALEAAPSGWSPAGGLAGAIMGTFFVRAQSCVRRSSVDTCVYVPVAPSNLDVGAACVRRSSLPRGTRPSAAPRPRVRLGRAGLCAQDGAHRTGQNRGQIHIAAKALFLPLESNLTLAGPGYFQHENASASQILTSASPPDRKLPRRPNDWQAMATARDKADAWPPASRP
jgi:hypothetical protein